MSTTLELDELWSFAFRRVSKRRVWIALRRTTRQVFAFVMGDRSERTRRKLWKAIPEAYQRGHFYSDFWEAYHKVTPDEQHRACGKLSGQIARV